MVLVGSKKENGKCINIEKVRILCDEIEGRFFERIKIRFIKVSASKFFYKKHTMQKGKHSI